MDAQLCVAATLVVIQPSRIQARFHAQAKTVSVRSIEPAFA
jgi:hypothetical protein